MCHDAEAECYDAEVEFSSQDELVAWLTRYKSLSTMVVPVSSFALGA